MATTRATVLYTRTGDLRAHRRQVTVEVSTPAEGNLTAAQEAALSLLHSADVRLEEAVPDTPTQEQMAAAIRGEAERQAARHAEELARMTEDLRAGRFGSWGSALAMEARAALPDAERAEIEARYQQQRREQEAARRARLEAQQRRKEEAARRAREERLREQERAQRRARQIEEWSAAHGSDRLRAQIAQGHGGWPLYLHERLAHELGSGARLAEEAEEWDEVMNPTEEQLAAEAAVVASHDSIGFDDTSIRLAPRDPDDWAGEVPRQAFVVLSWRPGDSAFREYSVAVPC